MIMIHNIHQYRDFRGIHVCGIVCYVCGIVYHVTLTHKCGIVCHICGTHKIFIFGFWQWFLCPKFRNHSNNKNPKEFFWNFHWKFFSKNLPYFITDWYHNCSIVYHKCWIVCSLCIPQLWYSTPQMWDIIPHMWYTIPFVVYQKN